MHSETPGAPRAEEWPVLFAQRVNAGDVEGIVALYEPDCRFVAPTGGMVSGVDAMRAVFAGLVNTRARMECEVVQVVAAQDVALLYSNFRRSERGASGQPMPSDQKAIEVLRRQADGTWKLVIGDPLGRMR